MSKYIIVSDSHYNEAILQELHQRYCDLPILHCGDSELSDASLVFDYILSVAGNCDFVSDKKPEERLIHHEEDIIWMCHGHRYNVKESVYPLSLKAREVGATIALFGHSHLPYCSYDENEDLLLLNPGSIELPRTYPPQKTYVLLETNKLKYVITYYDDAHHRLKQLTYQRHIK